ncbi:MAG: hypothetical protein A3F10_00885 [Coxiella sp. RIFCSPHIGHO2_12_FULL_42_15]|nr:MAG: hypothetical protein A3F10_00885 [Coxiella sp. RIFCSPHIGHO2_12_FULL_42_15]
MVNDPSFQKIRSLCAQSRCPEHFLLQAHSSLNPMVSLLLVLSFRYSYETVKNDHSRSQQWMQLFQIKRWLVEQSELNALTLTIPA